jgi:nitrogenase molybdenum-iron protein NifN
MNSLIETQPYVAVNPCRLCAPLGACLAFKGFERAMSVIHGSQGCATYIRRYAISHFREPIDIASSSFDEQAAVFGGEKNLRKALETMVRQYQPLLIGVVTNCLSETIGDDVPLLISSFKNIEGMPPLALASAPSYKGGWEDGYFEAVVGAFRAVADKEPGKSTEERTAFLPPLMSPADLRELKRIGDLMGISPLIAPDISDALDGGAWEQYHRLPPGGTPMADLRAIGGVKSVIDIGAGSGISRAGDFLKIKFGRKVHKIGLPLGITATDILLEKFTEISGVKPPETLLSERSRLIDAYFDGHKYAAGKRAVIVGEKNLCGALILWCREIGITPVLVASTGGSGKLTDLYEDAASNAGQDTMEVLQNADFDTITTAAQKGSIDLCFGSGKAQGMARELDIPLVRIGFPIHDRFGGSRLLTAGYRGTMELFDRVVNALIEKKQTKIPGGYSYL